MVTCFGARQKIPTSTKNDQVAAVNDNIGATGGEEYLPLSNANNSWNSGYPNEYVDKTEVSTKTDSYATGGAHTGSLGTEGTHDTDDWW